MTGELPAGDVEALRSRFDVIAAVRTTPRQKPALRSELNVSRSTIDRAVRELECAGLLTRGDDGYTVTLYGELLAERYETFVRDAAELANGRALLAALPREVSVHPDFLSGADVTQAGPPAGHHPITCFEKHLETAGRIRGLLHTISQASTPGLLVDRCEDGLVGEFVLGAGLTSHATPDVRERTKTLCATGIDFYELEAVPYGLVILDEFETDDDPSVSLFVYDESNELLGTIVNDTPDAVVWAEARYREHRQRATAISDPLSKL